MQYRELLSIYKQHLADQISAFRSLESLPEGYISYKTISGRKYAYLQKKIDGKMKSDYVKEDELCDIQAKLVQRSETEKRLKEIQQELKKLEAATSILSPELLRRMLALKRGAQMDCIPQSHRREALQFADAMTAVEGIPAQEQTNRALLRWENGEHSYSELYTQLLEQYRLI